MTDRKQIFAAISRERDYQDEKYGLPVVRDLSLFEYWKIAQLELFEAFHPIQEGRGKDALRELLQVATVCVAAIERHGLVEREVEGVNHD